LLVDAQLVNLVTIESRRQHAEIDGAADRVILLLRFRRARSTGGKRARAQQRQRDAGQDYRQADLDTQIKKGGAIGGFLFHSKYAALL
jgi:hypothetical protein